MAVYATVQILEVVCIRMYKATNHTHRPFTWFRIACTKVTIEQINTAFEAPQGLKALIQRVATDKCECAAKQCNGHGRCYGPSGQPQNCSCFEGFTGPSCSTVVQTGKQTSDVSLKHKTRGKNVDVGTVCPDGVSACAAGQTCAQFSVGR